MKYRIGCICVLIVSTVSLLFFMVMWQGCEELEFGYLQNIRIEDGLKRKLEHFFPQTQNPKLWILEFDRRKNPRLSTRYFLLPIVTTMRRWREWNEYWSPMLDPEQRVIFKSDLFRRVETICENILQTKLITYKRWLDLESEYGRDIYCFFDIELEEQKETISDSTRINLVFLLRSTPKHE